MLSVFPTPPSPPFLFSAFNKYCRSFIAPWVFEGIRNQEMMVVFVWEIKAIVSMGEMPTVCCPKLIHFSHPTKVVLHPFPWQRWSGGLEMSPGE